MATFKDMKLEYETTTMTLGDIADKYKYNRSYLRRIAGQKGWKKRDDLIQQTIEKAVDKRANKIQRAILDQKIDELAEKRADHLISEVEDKMVARKLILDKLYGIIVSEESREGDKLKAMDMLAKYCGLYETDNEQRIDKKLQKEELDKMLQNFGLQPKRVELKIVNE
jgi:hypothetical protein